jgi:NADH:ubiquinone oxidoreductase subunit 5 (subunit L)/multisubunit Na+/H+ antiporter MnhA subunit
MIMNQAIQIIAVPVLMGILLFLLPSALRLIKAFLAIGVVLFTGYLALSLFGSEDLVFSPGYWAATEKYCSLSLDGLSRLILLFMSFLSLMVAIYSVSYKGAADLRNFHAWFLITLGFSYGAVLANNLLLFLICWGILGISPVQAGPWKR